MALTNAERCAQWRAKQNPEKLKANQKAANAKYVAKIGIDVIRERSKIASAKWRKKHPKAHKLSDRKQSLRRLYGITIKEYNELCKQQSYRCAICNIHADNLSQNLAVDHCHKTNEIRGILCTNCNTGIGKLGDNVEGLEKALSYLRNNGK